MQIYSIILHDYPMSNDMIKHKTNEQCVTLELKTLIIRQKTLNPPGNLLSTWIELLNLIFFNYQIF